MTKHKREPGLVALKAEQTDPVAHLLARAGNRPVLIEHGPGMLAGTIELTIPRDPVHGEPAAYARVDDDGQSSVGAAWPDWSAPLTPQAAAARTTDPDTSREAARTITNLGSRHRAVLQVMRSTTVPITDERLVRLYAKRERAGWELVAQTPQSIRSRRAELVRSGYVEDSGARARMESGRRAIAWRLTDRGRTTTP